MELGVKLGLHTWKKKTWYDKPLTHKPLKSTFIDHVDLWKEVDKAIQDRQDTLRVEWVKGHGLPHHIARGWTTERDIWANNAADAIAGQAAREVGGQ